MKGIRIKKAGIVIVGFLFLCLVYAYAETYLLEIHRVDVVDSRIPSEFDNKTIVFVSDFHYGYFYDAGRVRCVVDRINSLKPDYIILGGDYLGDELEGYSYYEPLFEELKRLNSSVPKFGVLGNHDWSDLAVAEDGLRYAGIKDIDNVCVNLSSGIRLCGVGDLWEDIQIIEPGDANYTILVSHNPDYAEELGGREVDLVLSGHMHGGQVTFFGLWAPYLPSDYGQKYRSGLVDNGFNKVFVTRGVGQGLPVRFFARPEISVLTLKTN